MDNWSALQQSKTALTLIESAANRWGRDNLLDWPTKIGLIVTKTDTSSLDYVVESFYARMWRLGQKDPYSCSSLNEVITEVLWIRNYMSAFQRKFPAVFSGTGELTADVASITIGPCFPQKINILLLNPSW